LAVPSVPLSILAMTTPVSSIGFLYVLETLLLVTGLFTAPLRTTRIRGVGRANIARLAATMVLRVAFAGHGKTISMTRAGSASAPLLDCLSPRPTSLSPRRAP
jgi:hypothetical protein